MNLLTLIPFIFLLVIYFTINEIKGGKCSIKRCASINKVSLPSSQCVWGHTQNEVAFYDFQPSNCRSNEFCNFFEESIKNYSCILKPKKKALHDEPCLNNSDCYSDICYDNYCLGKAWNTPCDSHEECKSRYYCGLNHATSLTTIKKCLPQLGDKKMCSDDNECENDKGCFKLEGSQFGICTKYLSLPDGTILKPEQSLFCSSSFVYNEKCISSRLVSNEECQSEKDTCQYSYSLNDTLMNFTRKCECSDSYSEKKFCPMATTDNLYKDYLRQLKVYYECVSFRKHTLTRHNLDLNLNILKYKTYHFPKLKDADKCYLNYIASGNSLSFLKYVSLILIFLIL